MHPSIYLSILSYPILSYLSIYLICLFIYLSIYLSICLSIYLSIYLHIYPSVHPYIYLSVHPYIYTSIHQNIYTVSLSYDKLRYLFPQIVWTSMVLCCFEEGDKINILYMLRSTGLSPYYVHFCREWTRGPRMTRQTEGTDG